MSELKSNVWKYQVFSFLNYFFLTVPYMIIYFQNNFGFNLINIATYMVVFTTTVVIFEIPSGFFADKFGRKYSLIIAVFSQIMAFTIFYFGTNMYVIFLAGFFEGLSQSLISGADSALLYDSLLDMKQEAKYKFVDGRAKFYQETGVITAVLLGSLLVVFGIKTLILISIIIKIIQLLFTFRFIEPKHHKTIATPNVIKIFKESFKDNKLRNLFIYSAIVQGFSNTLYMIYQPYFSETGLTLQSFGLIFAYFSIFTAIGAHQAHRIEKYLGIKKSLILIPVLIFISYIFSGYYFFIFGFIFFAFREFARGYTPPVIGDYLNRLIKSDVRATVLSINGIFARAGYGIISFSFGVYADLFSIREGLLIFGACLLFAILFSLIIFRNGKKTLN